MPFALKNRLPTLQIVLPYNQRPFTWQPVGDPGGEDVQVIPDELRNDVSLIKAVKLGNLEMVEDESTIEAAYTQQREATQARATAQDQQIQSHLVQQSATAEMVGLSCIASRLNRPGVRCDVPVVLPLAQKDSRPPLCPEHIGQAPQYVRTQDGQWARVSRQQASNREGNPQS